MEVHACVCTYFVDRSIVLMHRLTAATHLVIFMKDDGPESIRAVLNEFLDVVNELSDVANFPLARPLVVRDAYPLIATQIFDFPNFDGDRWPRESSPAFMFATIEMANDTATVWPGKDTGWELELANVGGVWNSVSARTTWAVRD